MIRTRNEGNWHSPHSPKQNTTIPLTYNNTETMNNQPSLKLHIEALSQITKDFGAGILIIASYGQDPKTEKNLTPKVYHFKSSDNEKMVSKILSISKQSHRNVYMPLVLMRKDLPPGKKGGEKDIVSILGLVADFDDNDAHKWPERIPHSPSYVLETSPGRFQVGFVFDKPVNPQKAKKLAVALKKFCNCDHGTADISHVWRIPETLNWPNKKKVDAGRSSEPFSVNYFEEECDDY